MRQIAKLEREQFIERQMAASDARICRLTDKGRLAALSGRDPLLQWERKWDGQWRIVLFDVPAAQNAVRSQLRRYLRSRGLGYLQNNVLITPNPLEEDVETLRGSKIDVESLILLEARPCAGESDAEIVAGAWDFERINRLYLRHRKMLAQKPAGAVKDETRARNLRRWAAKERAAWRDAVTADPLLPERLLPPGYLGQHAWRDRVQTLRKAGRDMASFAWKN